MQRTLRAILSTGFAVAGVALALSLAVAANGRASDRDEKDEWSRHKGHVELRIPAAPVIAGDQLELESARKLPRTMRLEAELGGVPADLIRVDRHTVRIVVPRGVTGRQRLRVFERRSKRGRRPFFRQKIELGEIHMKTVGPLEDGVEFGLNFADSVGLSIGSVVDGWVSAETMTTEGTSSPINLSGTVTGRAANWVSILLTGDSVSWLPEGDEGPRPSATTKKSPTSTTLLLTVDLESRLGTGKASSGLSGTQFFGEVVFPRPLDPAPPRPQIDGIFPDHVEPGETVVIKGQGFGEVQNRSRVVLAGDAGPVAFARVLDWQDGAVEIRVPTFYEGEFDVYILRDGIPTLPVRMTFVSRCPPQPPFEKLIGGVGDERAYAIEQTGDCGYIIAGSTTSSPAQGTDALLIRTDGAGQVLWSRNYGGKGFDEARAVAHTADEGFVFVGTTRSSDLGASGDDFYVVKVDHDGEPEWTRVQGFATTERGLAIDVLNEHNNGAEVAIAVGGFTTLNAGRGTDALVYILDPTGEVAFTRVTGGSGDDRVDDLIHTLSEGFLAVGRTSSPDLGVRESGEFDAYALMLSFDASVRWQKAVAPTKGDDHAQSVAITPGGTYLLTGQAGTQIDAFSDFGDGGDVLLAELDESGADIRRREIGGAGQDAGMAGPFPTADGGFAVAGFSDSPLFRTRGSDALLIDTDCDLELRGDEIFTPAPNAERARAAVATFAPGFALAGEFVYSLGSDRRTDTDVLLAKTGPFASEASSIESFTVNGLASTQVAPGTEVTLHWRVLGADTIHITRTSGDGPAFDYVETGAAVLDGTVTLTVDVDTSSCGAQCSDVSYRLVAGSACGPTAARSLAVTVLTPGVVLSAQEERRLEVESTLVQRFDQPMGTLGDVYVTIAEGDGVRPMPSPHPDIVSNPLNPRSVCIKGFGIPYANASTEVAADALSPAVVDDLAPVLLGYRPDGTLLSWVYGVTPFFPGETTPPAGAPVPDSAWFAHYSGWHTGDGGMTIWGNDNFLLYPGTGLPLSPPMFCFGPPEFGGGLRLPYCGASPSPLVPHPAAWDVHLFRDLAGGGPPLFGRDTFGVGLPDPCATVPAAIGDCESGLSPLPGPGGAGASFFPAVNRSTGSFIPTACRP